MSAPGSNPLPEPIKGCPRKLGCIEILVAGIDFQPVADIAVTLIAGERAVRSLTDSAGLVRIEGLEEMPYEILLPGLDKSAAVFRGSAALPEVRLASSRKPVWEAATTLAPAPAAYTLGQGETFRGAVARLGFLPDEVWKLEANRALRVGRGRPWAKAGETIQLPERREAKTEAETGREYLFQLPGVPIPVGLRFMREDGSPKAGEPYLGLITRKSGAPAPVIEGMTNRQGFLETWVPEDSIGLEVTLGTGDEVEVHQIKLDEYVPASEPDGLQLRLRALGYYHGAMDGKPGPATREAVAAFQEDFGLDITGEPDEPTLEKLTEAYLS